MKITEELKRIPIYLRSNKILIIILMIFVFLYLINQDVFLNQMYKKLKIKDSEIIGLNSKLKKLKNETSSLAYEKNHLSSIQNSIKNLKLKLKKEETMLPKTFMIPTLINQISESSPASNFIIKKINFGKPVKTEGAMALSISISTAGGFNKLIKFIKNINSLKRIFVVDYISIKASKKSFPDIKANIKGVVFSMRVSD